MSAPPDVLSAPERRALRIEVVVVLTVTFGLSAVTATLQLIDFVLRGLAGQRVALNPRRSYFDLIDLGLNLAYVTQLVAWGALGVYLLWRSGFGPARIGLGRFRARADLLGGVGLAALIGLPGLALYVASRALGFSVSVVPSELSHSWWRMPMLVLVAFANGWAEEVVVVGYLLTRLRQFEVSPTRALLWSSLLRGAYHLYQGFGAFVGNAIMGVVFGLVYVRWKRVMPLVVAHAILDMVAFIGYTLAKDHISWLR